MCARTSTRPTATHSKLESNLLTRLPYNVFAALPSTTVPTLTGNPWVRPPCATGVTVYKSYCSSLPSICNVTGTELVGCTGEVLGVGGTLMLQNYAITAVRSDAFATLAPAAGGIDLSHNAIAAIGARAFTGLSCGGTLDLSHNNITTLRLDAVGAVDVVPTLDVRFNPALVVAGALVSSLVSINAVLTSSVECLDAGMGLVGWKGGVVCSDCTPGNPSSRPPPRLAPPHVHDTNSHTRQ